MCTPTVLHEIMCYSIGSFKKVFDAVTFTLPLDGSALAFLAGVGFPLLLGWSAFVFPPSGRWIPCPPAKSKRFIERLQYSKGSCILCTNLEQINKQCSNKIYIYMHNTMVRQNAHAEERARLLSISHTVTTLCPCLSPSFFLPW